MKFWREIGEAARTFFGICLFFAIVAVLSAFIEVIF